MTTVQRYTEAEKAILIENYDKLGLTGLVNSELLDRTYDSIKNMARNLGLTRPDRKNAPKRPRIEPSIYGRSAFTREHVDGFRVLRCWYRYPRKRIKVERRALVGML